MAYDKRNCEENAIIEFVNIGVTDANGTLKKSQQLARNMANLRFKQRLQPWMINLWLK